MEPTVKPNPKKRNRNEIANQVVQVQADQFEYQQRVTREQHRRRDEIAEQLQFLDRKQIIQLRPEKPPAFQRIKNRRNLTLDEHRRVIWLRFGSLDKFERMHYTSKEVFEMTGVKPSAQYMIIKRWLQHGKQIVSLVQRRGPKKMLSYQDRVYIANPKTLMDQRHLNLDQRAQLIKQERNLPKLSGITVWRVYREFGAKYIKPKIVYRSKNERQMELVAQQQQFSQSILRTIMHCPEVEIVYIDETTFNLWQAPSRVWLKEGMRIELPNQRGVSITMIGAISTVRGLFHTHTFAQTNNTDTFLPFILKLKEKCQGHPCLVVMDNLQVHKTKVVRDIFDDQFQQMFLPPQSCELNPIEKAWNIIKGQWRRTSFLMLDNNRKTDEKIKDAVNFIQGIADGQELEKMKKVAHCNYKSMELTLRGHMV